MAVRPRLVHARFTYTAALQSKRCFIGVNASRAREVNQRLAAKAGGAERDRTADLLIANEALSQLSYSPNGTRAKI